MRMHGRFFATGLATTLCVLVAAPSAAENLPPNAPPVYNSGTLGGGTGSWQHYLAQRRLREFRNEALRLRTADGGTFTPEHAQYLQKKLDRIRYQISY